MIDQLYIPIAVLLCVVFETIRIKIMHGKVVNIKKIYTKAIAVALFIAIAFIAKPWQHGNNWFTAILFVLMYGIAYGGCRGTIYDPLLNVLALKRTLWQDSTTTNSKQDQEEQRRKMSTYQQRALYAGVWVVFGVLYELSKKM
jgi:hypothetical protein